MPSSFRTEATGSLRLEDAALWGFSALSRLMTEAFHLRLNVAQHIIACCYEGVVRSRLSVQQPGRLVREEEDFFEGVQQESP